MDKIITQKVLNENTGELESQCYRRLKHISKIRGGYRMVYKSYDDIQVSLLKSSKDIEVFLIIRDKFTYARIESNISAVTISKTLNISVPKVSRLIKSLVDNDFLMRVDRGIYRLNPFMFIPYKSNAELLQKEWREIKNERITNTVEDRDLA